MTTSVSSSASSHTQIMTPPCQGSAENSVRQGMGGFYVNVTNSGQRGWVGMLFGRGGNWGPWYLGEPPWLCLSALYLGLPSPAVGHCWWCFSSQLAQNQEIVCPEGSWNHLAGRFKKKKRRRFVPPCYFFAVANDTLAPWRCLINLCGQMPVKPASWLWGRLPWNPWPRFCRGWQVSVSARDLPSKACCMCCPGREDRDGTLTWRLLVQASSPLGGQIACRVSFSCLQNPAVMTTKNPHTEKSYGKPF